MPNELDRPSSLPTKAYFAVCSPSWCWTARAVFPDQVICGLLDKPAAIQCQES